MNRRESIKWMLAVLAAPPLHAAPTAGYGSDPDLVKRYRSGDLWPLTFDATQRACAAALAGIIIPANAGGKSAADLAVHDFIDEWISAPYPRHAADRAVIVDGLAWLDSDARRLGQPGFPAATVEIQHAICDAIAWPDRAQDAAAARFFARFRDLTADGYYTTPEGMRELGFTGNTPSATFDGPPAAALKQAGVA